MCMLVRSRILTKCWARRTIKEHIEHVRSALAESVLDAAPAAFLKLLLDQGAGRRGEGAP
jgi:hypothetical protein